MSNGPQTVSSQKLIKDRLKHGQCIHCGIQTHKIVKKMFSSNEKVPISIPDKVDHGRCLNPPCLQAGTNVTVDPNDSNKPSRISGQTAGVIAVGTGAVLTAMGIPGGEVLSSVGQAVTESSTSSSSQPTNDFSGFDPSSYLNDYQNAFQNSLNQVNQQAAAASAAHPTTSFTGYGSSSYANNYQNAYQNIINAANQKDQQHNMQMQQYMETLNQQSQAATQNLMRTLNQYSAASSQFTAAVPQADPLQTCPAKHHATLIMNVAWPTFVCSSCMKQCPIGSYVYYCSICDWGTCATGDCRHQADRYTATTSQCTAAVPQADPLQTCPAKHHAPFMMNVAWPTFVCSSCVKQVPIGSYVYYCSLCDWGTCATGDCRHQAPRI